MDNVGLPTASVLYSYLVCPREAWFLAHHVSPDRDHPLLSLGRLVHETSYRRARKELFVDGLLKIDVIRGRLVAEVKRSSRHPEAARMQLAYYLYYLKHEKGVLAEGVLLFPTERRSERLTLTPELEARLEELLGELRELLSRARPPKARRIRYCKSCSYRELCWG